MTKYINEKEIDDNAMLEVSNAIKRGKIVVFKTDTVYGLGANAFDAKACKRIYQIKRRSTSKPLIVLISDVSMLERIVDLINPIEQKLIDFFWPGPLTILFKKKANALPDIVASNNEYIGVRLLETKPAYDLIVSSGVPLVAPSANLSGSPTGANIENIINELDGKVDYILDSGNINNDTTSTVVKVINEKITIVREGRIKKEELAKITPFNI